MDILALASFNYKTLKALDVLRAINSQPGIYKEIRRIISEIEILRATLQESAFTLARLKESPPYSALIAMKQCAQTGNELALQLEEFETSSRARRFVLLLDWVDRRARIKDLLEAFRVSTSLLREVTADAMTHALIRSEVLRLDGMIDKKLKDFETTFREAGRLFRLPSPSEGPEIVDPRGQNQDIGTTTLNANQSNTEPKNSVETPPGGDTLAESKEFHDFKTSGRFVQLGRVSLVSKPAQNSAWHPVKVTLDTGGDLNLVSYDVLQAMKFTGPFDESQAQSVKVLGGTIVHLRQRITLNWTLDKSPRTIQSDFYIAENEPFNILIGKDIIEKEGLLFEERCHFHMMRINGQTRAEVNSCHQVAENKRAEVVRINANKRRIRPSSTPNTSGITSPETASNMTSDPDLPRPRKQPKWKFWDRSKDSQLSEHVISPLGGSPSLVPKVVDPKLSPSASRPSSIPPLVSGPAPLRQPTLSSTTSPAPSSALGMSHTISGSAMTPVQAASTRDDDVVEIIEQ